MSVVFASGYICAINLLSMFAMYADKRKARKGAWRFKERTLFTLAIIGGAIGILVGSKVFRHKTKHVLFTYGIPLLVLVQVVTVYYVWGM